jgi:hypothetical protein
MTFLNLILVGGVAAAGIPIIIHLLNRSRYRVVRWGAMHLLDSAFKINRRRLRIEQLLLLLIRCLIPAVLALAMARPVLTSMAALVGAAKSSLVVLLDNSYSMEFGGKANGNFAQAKQATQQILEDLGRGSDASVLLMAGGTGPLLDGPTFDLGRLSKETSALDAGYGKAEPPEVIEGASSLASRMQHPFREIVVISDFQKVSWSDEQAPARLRARELLDQLPLKPQLTFLQVGVEGHDNVCVESLEFSRMVFGVGQPVQLRANLHNFGGQNYPELRVYFRVDGRERFASQVALGPHEQKQALFKHAFEQPGSHVVEVAVDADTLVADNSLQASIPVWDRVPVLLVNGEPSAETLKGETDFLEIALQPFGKAKADLTDLITTQVVEDKGLTAEALFKTRVVVLANIKQLADKQVQAVTDFVREGGGLLVFPGSRVNADWYNRTLAGNNPLLPAPLLSLGGSPDPNVPASHVVAQHYAHPALEMFNDPRNGSLGDGEVKLWFKTREPANDTSVTVLARMENGDPFLIERKFGEGRVIFCATPCDVDWNNLPVRPFYLPLMQRLVTYLASTVYPPRNVEVGKPLVAFLGKADAGKKATITEPAGTKYTVDIVARGARSVVEFTQAQRPGLYQLTAPDGTTIHFVVSTSREESNLQRLTPNELDATAKAMGATLVKSVKEYQQLDQARRFGREIWRPLFWLVLVLVGAELYLQQRIARRS